MAVAHSGCQSWGHQLFLQCLHLCSYWAPVFRRKPLPFPQRTEAEAGHPQWPMRAGKAGHRCHFPCPPVRLLCIRQCLLILLSDLANISVLWIFTMKISMPYWTVT